MPKLLNESQSSIDLRKLMEPYRQNPASNPYYNPHSYNLISGLPNPSYLPRRLQECSDDEL